MLGLQGTLIWEGKLNSYGTKIVILLAVAVFFGGALFDIEAQDAQDSKMGAPERPAPESNDRFALIQETLLEIEMLKDEIEAASST